MPKCRSSGFKPCAELVKLLRLGATAPNGIKLDCTTCASAGRVGMIHQRANGFSKNSTSTRKKTSTAIM